jgi:hypothetical protein
VRTPLLDSCAAFRISPPSKKRGGSQQTLFFLLPSLAGICATLEMASVGTYIAEWFRQRMSSAVTFQKQFVDDVTEKVKEQKAQFDRHTREANERAVQLHLDDLEEKYLCCVCGRGGEAREDDEYVYDTYSMVEMPPRMTLEAAVREELADAEMTDERIKQHQRELAVRQRSGSQATSLQPPTQARYSDDETEEDDDSSFASSSSGVSRGASGEKAKARHRKERRNDRRQQQSGRGGGDRHRVASREAARLRQREDGTVNGGVASNSIPISPTASNSPTAAVRQGRVQTAPGENRPGELAVMDPDMVGPLEVRNTLYKIRHAVLHKEARTRRKSVAVHKDKGLMKIEESEIDMFSHFFQRPVHGYLCNACYTCARRRLDTLTQQIRGILFKAQNPILRRVAPKEIIALSSSSQVPLVLIQSILTVQKRWANMSEAERMSLRGTETTGTATQPLAATLENEERTSWNAQVNGEDVLMGSLSEKNILLLREEAKCGACQRRSACFFEQRSVVFLCQFCTARDRFYRENAVCINDEAMPLNLVHMLHDFATYYEALHQQRELRGAPQSAINEAQTDLFSLTEVMRESAGLFAYLSPATTNAAAQSAGDGFAVEETHSNEPVQSTSAQPVDASVATPSTFAATNRIRNNVKVPLREQRQRVGRTMVSLFDGVKVESTGLNLFNIPQEDKTTPPAATAAVTSQTPTPLEADVTNLFDFTAPAPPNGSAGQQVSGAPAVSWSTTAAGVAAGGCAVGEGQTQVSSPPPPLSGAAPSTTQNIDWDSLL